MADLVLKEILKLAGTEKVLRTLVDQSCIRLNGISFGTSRHEPITPEVLRYYIIDADQGIVTTNGNQGVYSHGPHKFFDVRGTFAKSKLVGVQRNSARTIAARIVKNSTGRLSREDFVQQIEAEVVLGISKSWVIRSLWKEMVPRRRRRPVGRPRKTRPPR